AKDNGTGVTGVNPNAEIYSVRVLDDNIEAPLSRIVEGIQWGIDNNMDIINMSFGTNTNSSILRTAIKEADEAGILLISATGNDNTKGVQYPASYPEVLAVGSMDENSQISDFTSVGEELDVIAPGEKIETTGIFGTINGTEGTSVATAQVSAVASKILEKDKSKTPDFVKKLIIASSKRVEDAEMVTGAVDLNYALEIYDDFAQNYTQNEDVQEYTNPQTPEEYDSDGFVKGLWLGENHAEMANKAGTFTTGNNLKLIIAGARAADKTNEFNVGGVRYSLNSIKAFHGFGNYVLNLRCGWNFIHNLYMYKSKYGEEAINIAYDKAYDTMEKTPSYYTENLVNNSIFKAVCIMEEYLLTLRDLTYIDFKKIFSNGDFVDNKNANSTLYKATGLFIHMVGDIYAHRSIVPPSFGTKNNYRTVVGYDYDSIFNWKEDTMKNYTASTVEEKKKVLQSSQSSQSFNFFSKYPDYRSLKVLEIATSYGAVEFQDIRKYSKPYVIDKTNSNVSKAYADNVEFYKKRYNEAVLSCESFFYSGFDSYFDYNAIVPSIVDYNKCVKLFNLKKFMYYAGVNLNNRPDYDWDAVTGYVKKVDSNGNILDNKEI
ncbi:MAG: S8 family serine peptidase, partial [Ruminococcus sp.]